MHTVLKSSCISYCYPRSVELLTLSTAGHQGVLTSVLLPSTALLITDMMLAKIYIYTIANLEFMPLIVGILGHVTSFRVTLT